MKVYLETYGCTANKSDSEIIAGLLKEKGFELVDSPENSDLNIINTCIVKTPTEQRMKFRIKQLTKIGKPLVVAGCMTKTEQKIIEKINPNTTMIGPDSIERIVDAAEEALKGNKVIYKKNLRKPKINLPRLEKSVHITQISTGCNGNCSYCIVKLAKGELFCYPSDLIIKDIEKAVKNGCKEIRITSQDNATYNYEGVKLPELLKEICKIEGKFSIRVGMMNPSSVKIILDELIDVYKNEKIRKFLHLPLQSGSDRILKLMNRGYKSKDFVEIVERFRKEIPDLFLSTDVIVGFPGETEEDFNMTLELLKNLKFDKVNISKFGPRPGTLASRMKQLNPNIIKQRSKILHEICKKN